MLSEVGGWLPNDDGPVESVLIYFDNGKAVFVDSVRIISSIQSASISKFGGNCISYH